MLHPSTKRLIEKLDEMTRKQRVAWKESENGAVTHDTEGYRVTLTPAPHTMYLTDTQGREIETCVPEDFTGETGADGQPFTNFVAALYGEAHRHARGAEKAISALLDSLDQADAEGVPEPEPMAAPEAETFEHAEDEGDDSQPLEEQGLPEYEGQADMQAAVAAMADEVNATDNPETAPAEAEAEPAHEAPASQVEQPPQPPETARAEPPPEPEPQPVADTPPAPEPAAPAPVEPPVAATPAAASTYAPFSGSTENATAYAVAAEFAAPAPAPAEEAEPPAEPPQRDTLSGDNDIWEAIQNAGASDETATTAEPAAETEPPQADITTTPQQEPEPVPEPEPAPANKPGPVFGGGLFSGGMGSLDRYRTQASEPPAPAPEPEPPAEPKPAPVAEAVPTPQPEPKPAAPEPEPVAETAPPPQSEPQPEAPKAAEPMAGEAAPEPPSEPEPEPAPAPPKQRFSLSGITSGFGLGANHPPARSQMPAEPPEPKAAAEPEAPTRKVIDGTVDLPDAPPEPPLELSQGVRMEDDDGFGFTDADLMPGVEAAPLPAAPQPPEAPKPAEPVSKTDQADSKEEEAQRPARRFNPWN